MKWMLLALMFVGLAGCTLGMKEDGSNAVADTFSVPASYQVAYRRADAYARHCHGVQSPLKDAMSVTGDLFSDTRSGVIRITSPSGGNDLERIAIAETNGQSSVTIKRWDVGIWDARETSAAKSAIATGNPVCRS
jgi:hypothetical protein